MDLFNNSIGYQLGDLAKQNKWSEERLFKEIIKYKNDEKLQTKLTSKEILSWEDVGEMADAIYAKLA